MRGAMLILVVGLIAPVRAATQTLNEADRALAREILAEMIAVPTVEGSGLTVPLAEGLAARLIAEGFPEEDVRVMGPTPDLGNLLVRLRGTGTGLRPILLLAHMDVVPAVTEAWSTDPYQLVEQDGYFYARGTSDNKGGASMLLANLIRYRREGYVPERDIIVLVTADEETTSAGIRWMVDRNRELVDAEFALNTDSGGGELRDGERAVFGVQASEKMYLTFRLTAENPGGHSSRPRPDNAINEVATALTRIAAHDFEVRLDDVTRTFFERSAATKSGQEAADMRAVAADEPDLAAAERLSAGSPYFNALLHTTCIATRLEAGHADNALPRSATATVNCRIFPGVPADEVQQTLERIVDNPSISFTRDRVPTPSPPSPLDPAVMDPVRELVDDMFGEIPIIPTMSTGATDGLYARNAGIPVYGISAIFSDPEDARAHGQDERVGVEEYFDAVQFWYRLVKRLASPRVTP